MKPVQKSSQAMIMEQANNITTSIYTWVPLNHSSLNIIQRVFQGFFSRVQRFNNGLTIGLGCMQDTSAHPMVWHSFGAELCESILTSADLYRKPGKAIRSSWTKMCRRMWCSDFHGSPRNSLQMEYARICTWTILEVTALFSQSLVWKYAQTSLWGVKNICAYAMISMLWNVMKGYTVLGDQKLICFSKYLNKIGKYILKPLLLIR